MPNCTECNFPFDISEEENLFCHSLQIPTPPNCPKCRLIRRLNERNARKLYYRKCDFSSKKIISMYHEDQPFPVYDQAVWWSDKWDGLDYGQDFDFNRSFFEQYREFINKVPHFSVFTIAESLENSEFTNCTGYLKNCYLISESDYNEDCQYSNRIYHCKDLLDCSNCYNSEGCYESIDCINCTNLKYSLECENCQDSFALENCIGCSDCIGLMNQRHQQFMILDKQYSKEEFNSLKESLNLNSHSGIVKFLNNAKSFFQNKPKKGTEGQHNENVVGDHVYNSKNAFQCFDCKDLEDCMYCTKVASSTKNCIDYTSWGFQAELIYNCASCGDNAYNLKFCSTCTTNISNLEYCFQCTGSNNLFGCAGLKKKSYCIFNKQYSKEDFVILRERIIKHMESTGEWGQYFPKDICTFGYNETIAMDHFPITKEEALSKGYKWCDYEMPLQKVEKTISPNDVPDSIKDIPETIINWAIVCETTNKPFNITKQELAFYKKHDIPCPRIKPDQRHANRMKKRPEYRLDITNCSKCQRSIYSNITTGITNPKYCEDCFKNLIY